MKLFVSDLGNVILFFDVNVALEKFKNMYSINPLDIRAYFKKNDIAYKIDTGELTPKKLHFLFNKKFQVDIPYEIFCNIWNEIFVLNNQYIEFVDKIKNDYKLAILSNTNEVHWKYIIKTYPKISKLFKHIILSYEEGLKKPNPEIYNKVLKIENNPKKIVFIDDLKENIEAAKNIGINAIQYKNFKQFKKDFYNIT